MAIDIYNVGALAACNAIVDGVDADSPTVGYVEIRTGSKPANCEAASTGTLLVSIDLNDPAFGAAADANPGATATLDLTGGLSGTAVADGTAAHFRMFTGGDVCVMQGTVTATGGGGDMTIGNTTVATSDTVTITALTATMPESAA